ncbi:hypothetical protein [Streptomyces sp. NPDC004728]|uniref:hypothetical protein n=1 Tax=Streptomyces sp. NPDC004728 TaxID=3154289 RepID=UPI0033A6FBB1
MARTIKGWRWPTGAGQAGTRTFVLTLRTQKALAAHAHVPQTRHLRGASPPCGEEVPAMVRHVIRKATGWLLMIVVATNAT